MSASVAQSFTWSQLPAPWQQCAAPDWHHTETCSPARRGAPPATQVLSGQGAVLVKVIEQHNSSVKHQLGVPGPGLSTGNNPGGETATDPKLPDKGRREHARGLLGELARPV